ncbi:MAG TPA: hypothetical protein VKY81_10450 [Natronosporangium sp.]|nr:hypothetical protein [Natronosporangium sp.]
MRASRVLARDPDLCVSEVVCRAHHPRWSPVESPRLPELVQVRSGRFRYAGRFGTVLAGTDLGYLSLPGEHQRFAHPAGGDVCTAIAISPRLWQELSGGDATGGPVPVDARLHLAHRLLLRAAAGADTGVRSHVGCTPTQVRRLFGRAAGRGSGGPAAPPHPRRSPRKERDSRRQE